MPNQSGEKLSQEDLIDARNAERCAKPAWYHVYSNVSQKTRLEEGDYTVNWPWVPGLPLVTHRSEQIDQSELCQRAIEFHRNEIAMIEQLSRGNHAPEKSLSTWNRNRSIATETRDWSNLLALWGERLRLAERSAIHWVGGLFTRRTVVSIARQARR